MPRASWKGFVRLSLVTIPVQAYTATATGGGTFDLHLLHSTCHSRIRYRKICPIHGEVPNEEIVRGYEYAPDQYVVIDLDELDKLRTESDKSITIDRFVAPGQIDARYYSGRTYYLTPDGPAGGKAYVLLQRAMNEDNLLALAQVVLAGREQLVALRPLEKLIALEILSYESQVKSPRLFGEEVPEISYSGEELKLTRTLVAATTSDTVDLSQYQDLYTQRLRALIEAKVEGKELVTPPAEEAPQVINLMDALRASVQRAQAEEKPARPKRRAAGEKPRRGRKTG